MDVAVEHAASREALAAALALPPALTGPVVRYLSLFRPARRQLTMSRFGALLGELVGWVNAGQVERKGRTWPAPVEYWTSALQTVMDARDAGTLRLPLKSHGYLLEVLVGISDKTEGQAERREEERRAYAYSETRLVTAPTPVARVVQRSEMPTETRKVFDQVLRTRRSHVDAAGGDGNG